MMICQVANEIGRLNAFQRVMLQWSELHPYNAVHTYQLAGPLCFQKFRRAVREAFDFNGLGLVEVDCQHGWYRHEPDKQYEPEIRFISGGGSQEELLTANIVSELNRHFERPCCCPFRFSVFDNGSNSHFISMIYDHWIADSIGARLVMRHILGRYLGLDIPENRKALDLYPPTYRTVFSQRLGGHRLIAPLWRSFKEWVANRKTWRVAYGSTNQMSLGFIMQHISHDVVQRIQHFARSNDASVNDVLLAALTRAMVPYMPRRFARTHGTTMTLGTIVDTRADTVEDLSESLGTFLGYYLVRVVGDTRVSLRELTQQIAAATKKRKRQQSYLDAAVNLRLSGMIWSRLHPKHRPFFALRALPMSAGISNVYLRNTWINTYGEGKILGFSRACPNGPALPLAISPTTFKGKMNVGFTYRETGFSRSKIEAIVQAFIEQLESVDAEQKTHRPAATKLSAAAID